MPIIVIKTSLSKVIWVQGHVLAGSSRSHYPAVRRGIHSWICMCLGVSQDGKNRNHCTQTCNLV